jgi:hypothetical protein|tara:strand:+ start:2239 stop:2493 length:255 start_codon:yes stop_codon:yes gene_type:complete
MYFDIAKAIKDEKDKSINPDHYSQHKIQPINFILANELGFCEGNVIKYICRYQEKGHIEDLKKAKAYIEFLIQNEQNFRQEAGV